VSFGAKADDVPVLYDYAAAARHEAAVKPIRGRTPECKPLGDRKKTHASIRREGEDIIVRLYRTDIVRYQPDGTVIVNQGGHESLSTRAYLNSVLPLFFGSYRGATAWYDGNGRDGNGRDGYAYHLLHARKDNIFKHNPNNVRSWEFTNPEPCVVHQKNRAGAKWVRAKYAPFLKYVRNIKKLLGADGKIERSETPVKWLSKEEVIALALSSDREDHYKAMYVLAWAGRGFWHGPADPIAQFEKVMLRHHRDEMLTAVTLPPGVLAVDKFRGLF
jgi:hypothetical protein